MTIDLSQFHQVFFEEAAEHLATMESLLLSVDVETPSPEDLNAIFRAAHSIKGSSGIFGFTDIVELTHKLETLLDRLRKQELRLRPEMVDAFLAAVDILRAQLDHHQGGPEADAQQASRIGACLAALAGEDQSSDDGAYGFFAGAPGSPAQTEEVLPPAPGEDVAPAAVKQEDPGFGLFEDAPGCPQPSSRAAVSAGDSAAAIEGEGYGIFAGAPGSEAIQGPPQPAWGRRSIDRPDVETASAGRRATDKSVISDASIRVPVEKVDQLINLVGELVITQAMLAQSAGSLHSKAAEKLLSGIEQLARNTRELQEAVMAIRMVPMRAVFSRFPRLVRDLAGKLGKQVELKIVGEGTELDKGLVEKIVDPLTHLVRNSLDHGIETPERRLAAGKPPQGSLTLRASHQGGNIVIEVIDDGSGLNRDRILAKAREKGMSVSEAASDQEVFQLIFAPGFSTAAAITDVSGRGVGMDVVKKNIESLGGRVELDSSPGFGTSVTIRLPLTLAILDGMLVRVCGETFVLPLTGIVESLQPKAGDIRTLGGDARMVYIRGEYLPLVSLTDVFKLGPDSDLTRGIVVVVDSEEGKAALLVDELLGQQQVVIKSLEANYRKVPGVSAATILGDGRVALILDLAAITRLARINTKERKAA